MLSLANDSDLQAQLLPSWNALGERQHTLIIKTSHDFDLDGNLTPSSEPAPIIMTDEWRGEPRFSSLAAANESAPFKQNAEYYLFGSACPVNPCSVMRVSLALESDRHRQQKVLRVLGEHQWESHWLGALRGKPAELAPATPLHYELAYGGHTGKRDTDKQEEANPAGRGFNPSAFKITDPRAPLIEYDQEAPASSPRQKLTPAGFGPLPALWAPRRQRMGEINTDPQHHEGCPWDPKAAPDLHHCAPDDQQWPHAFAGDERLTLQGFFAERHTPLHLNLPVQPIAPQLIDGGQRRSLSPQCDTLVIDTDRRQLHLIWRCALAWHSPLDPRPVTLWLPPELSLSRNESDEQYID
ncbi:DUF2169 family type VI secretion system accessory protein [Isoalcanivorax indicus]|uniref:DUF2169 family type VI secretion system accessory protein n=1 Tax=Isoalcanivorax indicus TaxID=2202653 RepID=UPI000DBA894D|nr:DUF2169 domain-containing protein [Isoalcanivorax indicus]